MSGDAINRISSAGAASAVSSVQAAQAAAPSAKRSSETGESFGNVLERHLNQPRADIASIRSEIASIRSGAVLFEPRRGFDAMDARGSHAAALEEASPATASGFTRMPPSLDALLPAQATGDQGDPYGWRASSRQIAERIIGPGYGALFERQMDQESGFNPDVVYGLRVSSAGAEGIAQLMPQYYPNVDRTDPIAGLTAGAETMRHYLSAWDGDVRRALASYNAGLGRVQSLVKAHGANWESGLPLETRHYLNAILGPATPVFESVKKSVDAVFGGRGAGGVLTAPLEGAVTRRSTERGVDYLGASGAAVRSPSDGVVVAAGDGRLVIDHGNQWRTILEGVQATAAVGQSVRRSESVGVLGSGGLLRLGVTSGGATVDPTPYLLSDV